jgi:phosphatidate cytidylyltransferase
MLRERIAIVLLLFPPVLWLVAVGGWLFALAVALVLGLAGAEFGLLFRRHGARPSIPILGLGPAGITLLRQSFGFENAHLALAGLCTLAMVWHALDYERGASNSGSDFALTLGGTLYVGWMGAYLVSLRGVEGGEWWLLLGLPAIWLADSAAYSVGKRYGRHRLAPRLSPNKSWEGYLAGVLVGAAAGFGLTHLWLVAAGPESGLTASRGLLLGGIVAAVAPVGDLGVSMLKREVGAKDSGRLLPGHGGALDRLDTWIWSAALTFYYVGALGN